MRSAIHPHGAAAQLAGAAPEGAALFENFTSQAVTPVTESSSRYFFSWGPHKSHGDAALAQAMLDVAIKAFLEDKQIIEGQQKVLKQLPDSTPMPTPADRAVVQFQRVMNRLAQKDAYIA